MSKYIIKHQACVTQSKNENLPKREILRSAIISVLAHPIVASKLSMFIYVFYFESQTSIHQNMRLDQYSRGRITVIQRHTYQFMVRESMRIVKYSSSVLLPSYFADRRWMRNFWRSGGRQ